MPLITYKKSKYTDFSQPEVSAGQLFTEIENSKIDNVIVSVTENIDDVSIVFEGSLTIENQTILDNLIVAHKPKKSMFLYEQHTEYHLANTNVVLTADEFLNLIFVCTPTDNRTITLPIATDITSTLHIGIDESIDFSVINQSTIYTITIIADTIFGSPVINAETSGRFKLRLVNPGTTYVIYRLS